VEKDFPVPFVSFSSVLEIIILSFALTESLYFRFSWYGLSATTSESNEILDFLSMDRSVSLLASSCSFYLLSFYFIFSLESFYFINTSMSILSSFCFNSRKLIIFYSDCYSYNFFFNIFSFFKFSYIFSFSILFILLASSILYCTDSTFLFFEPFFFLAFYVC